MKNYIKAAVAILLIFFLVSLLQPFTGCGPEKKTTTDTSRKPTPQPK
jgi:hypothetical protein